MSRIGVIADDLTGAGDTGLQFHRGGQRTWVVNRLPAEVPASSQVPAEIEAVAVNVGTRHLDAEGAADRVAKAARWLLAAGCERFYHKIDSTLRGNLAAEIPRIRREIGARLAVVAPAFPEAGRTTIGGYQLVGGVPVALSDYGRDPICPALESHLPTLLAATGETVAVIGLRTVLLGWEAIAGALAEAKAGEATLIVVDAARSEDLAALALALSRFDAGVLPVGSAGFAAAMQPYWLERLSAKAADVRVLGGAAPLLSDSQKWSQGRILARTAPILVISGSANAVTLDQLGHLGATARIVLLDVKRLLLTEGGTPIHDEIAMSGRQALQGLLAGRDVVVTTALSADQVTRDQELGRHLGMTRGQVGAALASALGAMARHLSGLATLSGIVIAGGETADAVCRALPGERLEIMGEVGPAIPLLRVVGRNLRVVTKSGGFGEADTLRLIVDLLRQTEEVA